VPDSGPGRPLDGSVDEAHVPIDANRFSNDAPRRSLPIAMTVIERRFTIRRARNEDAAAIAHLAEATFTETFGHLYPPEDLAAYVASAYGVKTCLEALSDRRMAYWLADADGEHPVGFAHAGYCKLPVEGLEPRAGELRQLYVRSAYQNQGLGARLFEAALPWLEARYSPLYIGVWSKNYGAQRFYARYGFVKVGEYGFPVGKTVDLELILRR
jgi:diamine N-acetyltransferase